MNQQKLRILCFHGWHGSAEILRSQMYSFAKPLESLADFVCVDAPSLSRGDIGWWNAKSGGVGRDSEEIKYVGWEETRDWLIKLFQKESFDGIFGFSQGAALVGLVVGMRAADGQVTDEFPLKFDFAMAVGGFNSRDPLHKSLYSHKESYDLPSLHLIGQVDGIVPPQDSRTLAAKFKNPLILEHNGGHIVASTPSIQSSASQFLSSRLQQKYAI